MVWKHVAVCLLHLVSPNHPQLRDCSLQRRLEVKPWRHTRVCTEPKTINHSNQCWGRKPSYLFLKDLTPNSKPQDTDDCSLSVTMPERVTAVSSWCSETELVLFSITTKCHEMLWVTVKLITVSDWLINRCCHSQKGRFEYIFCKIEGFLDIIFVIIAQTIYISIVSAIPLYWYKFMK